jgi:hypothetical protein
MTTTGEKQRALAKIIAEYAAVLSHGELRAAIRLGKPDIFEQTCFFCDSKLELRCSNPECSTRGSHADHNPGD